MWLEGVTQTGSDGHGRISRACVRGERRCGEVHDGTKQGRVQLFPMCEESASRMRTWGATRGRGQQCSGFSQGPARRVLPRCRCCAAAAPESHRGDEEAAAPRHHGRHVHVRFPHWGRRGRLSVCGCHDIYGSGIFNASVGGAGFSRDITLACSSRMTWCSATLAAMARTSIHAKFGPSRLVIGILRSSTIWDSILKAEFRPGREPI